jgi:hypothetical protein
MACGVRCGLRECPLAHDAVRPRNQILPVLTSSSTERWLPRSLCPPRLCPCLAVVKEDVGPPPRHGTTLIDTNPLLPLHHRCDGSIRRQCSQPSTSPWMRGGGMAKAVVQVQVLHRKRRPDTSGTWPRGPVIAAAPIESSATRTSLASNVV